MAELGYGEIMVEAGATLTSAFIESGLADEIVLYQAPKILGNQARGLFALPENPLVLSRTAAWQTTTLARIGDDIKWVLHPRQA